MRRLRKKIEDDPSNPKYIKTLWGIGYKLEVTTISSSLIVVMIACASNPAFSMVTFIPLQLALAAVGVTIAYSAIQNIEKEDAI